MCLTATQDSLHRDAGRREQPAHGGATEDLYATDEFCMYCMKVLPCSKRLSHNWQACVFAHFGEKARRRDLRTHTYSSQLCPDAKREGGCPRGDACTLSHNIFESWLHPELYRTQLCTAGASCTRTMCFFAHSQEQLRKPAKQQSSAAAVAANAATTCPASSKQRVEMTHTNVVAAAAAASSHGLPAMAWPAVQTEQGSNNGGKAQLSPQPTNTCLLLPQPQQQQVLLPQHQQQQQQVLQANYNSTAQFPDQSFQRAALVSPGTTCSSSISTVMQQQMLPLVASSSNMVCHSPAASLDGSGCCSVLATALPSVSMCGGSHSPLAVITSMGDGLSAALPQPTMGGQAIQAVQFPAGRAATCATGLPYAADLSAGLAGDLLLLQPAAATAALLQQQEKIQQQELLLLQQEQQLQQQQALLQLLSLGQPVRLVAFQTTRQ